MVLLAIKLFFQTIILQWVTRLKLYFSNTKPKKVYDGNGDSVTLTEYDGMHFTAFSGLPQNMASIKDFQAREGDIWILNWPKSGTHWLFEILCMLTNGKAELVKKSKVTGMYPEAISLKTVNQLDSPRILDTHVPVKYFPRSALENSKIIYTVRNPKDAFVSLYHHTKNIHMYNYNGSWDGFFRMVMDGKGEYGSWFDHTEGWMKEIEGRSNVMIVQYEGLKKNFMQELKRIADFVGYPRPELYKEIAAKTTIQNMQKNKAQMKVIFKNETGMFRKGVVGDWMNHFTLAQNDEIEEMIKERMPNISLKLDFA